MNPSVIATKKANLTATEKNDGAHPAPPSVDCDRGKNINRMRWWIENNDVIDSEHAYSVRGDGRHYKL